MEREFRVLSRLSRVYPLAPTPYLYCGDDSVLGAPFYVMERRYGIVCRKGPTPGLDPTTLRRLCEALIDNLARLHAIDPAAAGLGDLGRPEGYVERQVSGWTRRYLDAQTGEVPDVARVMAWLAANRPAESGTALIHNDYKFDNLLLDVDDGSRIVAVLDWEMATVGDPRADLGYLLSFWPEPGEQHPLIAQVSATPGFPSRAELVAEWERCTRREAGELTWFVALGLWKLAVLLEASYHRHLAGTTDDPFFATLGDGVPALLARAREVCGA
jgi:aminoglycoside phosphotransferase (APT) family kinase protein